MIVHIAPDHAGIVAGISAFWYTLSSLGNPLAIGYIVTDHVNENPVINHLHQYLYSIQLFTSSGNLFFHRLGNNGANVSSSLE